MIRMNSLRLPLIIVSVYCLAFEIHVREVFMYVKSPDIDSGRMCPSILTMPSLFLHSVCTRTTVYVLAND